MRLPYSYQSFCNRTKKHLLRMVKSIDVIGEFNAVLENKFNKDTNRLKQGDTAVISITSHGGQVETLKRMSARVLELKNKGVEVVTFVPEYANSAGFFFFLLGDHREVAETA